MVNIIKKIMNNTIVKCKHINKRISIARGARVFWKDTYFEGYNKIGERSVFRGMMGYGSYIGRGTEINATIGRYCCISDRVYTVSGKHPTNTFISVHPAFYSTRKQSGFTYVNENFFEEVSRNPIDGKASVYIGNDVWIGCDVTILGGVIIGDGAIIAAGSVVSKDVAPYSIVGGVPATILKKRFDEEEIDFLLDFKWWDKELEWIESNSPYFRNIDDFFRRYKV